MSAPVANCPSCGAEIRFQWAGAVQTVCAHCSSIVVRRDVDLEAVGRVSEPPPVTSRIRIGTTGTYNGRRFTVVGRIAYAWEAGAWSEWHLAFGDGRGGWLSDAQDEYAVTFAVPHPPPLPPAGSLQPGQALELAEIPGGPYTVGAVTRARYAGVEGELPFEYWGKDETPFADLRSAGGHLATIDYSGDPPLLFAGEFVEFGSLQLRELADPPARRVEGTKSFTCPSCGGAVRLQRPGETVTAVCEYCLTVLDATDERLTIVQKFNDRVRVKPLIPLGSTGRMHGAEWTVLGMQQRTLRVEGVAYSWREYLLHAPERGFRYLTEYDGHWNDVLVLKDPPNVGETTRGPVILRGEHFRPFQHASAETTFVLGEFPWRIRVGDKAQTDDYVSPPRLLSREKTADEVTWSLGEYTPPRRIWEAFKLPGNPPLPRGTFANQPSPHAGHRRLWPLFFLLAFLLVAALFIRAGSAGRTVFEQQGLAYDSAAGDSSVFVSPEFELGGRPSAVRVSLRTNLHNSWAGFDMTLVDAVSGRTREFSRELGYYEGYEDGERWTEGDNEGGVTVPAVPAGIYRLVIAPQSPGWVSYSVRVTRDAPSYWLYFLALLALLVPPAVRGLQHVSFEHQRWMESDYPPVTSDEDDDE
jgi:predicted RNA-binding Zn-ribbon protein involved in translation (DUF1610 family)